MQVACCERSLCCDQVRAETRCDEGVLTQTRTSTVLLFGVIGVAVTMAGPLQHAVAVETEPDARAELAAQLSVAYLGMLLVNVVLAIISLIIQGTTEALHHKEKEE